MWSIMENWMVAMKLLHRIPHGWYLIYLLIFVFKN